MIARFILFLVVFAVLFFSLYWAVFRTKFFTAERVLEIVKTFGIAIIALASAGLIVGAILMFDQLS